MGSNDSPRITHEVLYCRTVDSFQKLTLNITTRMKIRRLLSLAPICLTKRRGRDKRQVFNGSTFAQRQTDDPHLLHMSFGQLSCFNSSSVLVVGTESE